MIKTILFDLGNVVIPFDFKRAYARMAELCGCSAGRGAGADSRDGTGGAV